MGKTKKILDRLLELDFKFPQIEKACGITRGYLQRAYNRNSKFIRRNQKKIREYCEKVHKDTDLKDFEN